MIKAESGMKPKKITVIVLVIRGRRAHDNCQL
jgi:hypothetical protein